MLKLDPTKPYGKIVPAYQPDDFDRPAHYEQAGRCFDAHYREIIPGKPMLEQVVPEVAAEADRAPAPAAKPAAPKKATKAETKAVKTASPAMTWDKMAGKEEPVEAAPAKAPSTPAAPGTVDLAAWGRGQKNYLFAEVRKAIRSQHNRTINGGPQERTDAVDFLIDAGIITAAEARQDVRK